MSSLWKATVPSRSKGTVSSVTSACSTPSSRITSCRKEVDTRPPWPASCSSTLRYEIRY